MIQAERPCRPPDESEAPDRPEADAPERLAVEMVAVRDEFGLKVLGVLRYG